MIAVRPQEVFDRFIDILLPKGGYVVALYEAYIDESYTDDRNPPLLVVGGYVFRSESAKQLAPEWQAVLEAFQVPLFHMVDVAPGYGIFKSLGDARCDEMARKMFALIKQRALFGFAAAINPERPWDFPQFPDDPYAFALSQCIDLMTRQLTIIDSQPTVLFIFESGHKKGPSAGKVLDLLNQQISSSKIDFIRSIRCGFAPKQENCLLQSADILVWQLAKFIKDKHSNKRALRRDFRSLLEITHVFGVYYTYGGQHWMVPIMGDWITADSNDYHRRFIAKAVAQGFGPDGPPQPPVVIGP